MLAQVNTARCLSMHSLTAVNFSQFLLLVLFNFFFQMAATCAFQIEN